MKALLCFVLSVPALANCWHATYLTGKPSANALEPCGYSLLYASSTALIVSQLADGITTARALNHHGVYESNPIGLNGAVTLKATATVSLLSAEWLLRNHRHAANVFSILNLGLSVEFGSAAFHNARTR